ncbi:cytochrome P450 6k1-like [Bacillus rossius redtenbacheri]|uniref:cytochrome P450 6k1-like n=1 Tax=Bacillus rossius redtenbacheri TaxID=93214 RepID=UPI002FDDB04B
MAMFFSSALADVALFLVTCYLLVRLYIAHAFTYWEKRGVYHVKPTSVFGNLSNILFEREHTSECLERLYKESVGQPMVGLFVMRRPILMVRDLSLLRCVFVKDAHVFLDRNKPNPVTDDLFTRSLFAMTGRRWRDLRIKLTPTFTSGKIKRMFHLIDECGKRLPPCIELEASKGDAVAVKEVIARYSTDVIASCAFGVDANALADPQCEFRAVMKRIFEVSPWKKLIGVLFFVVPSIPRLLKLSFIDEGVYDFVRRTFWEVVDYRKRNKVVRDDFVDLLVQIKREGRVRADDDKDAEEIQRDSAYMDKLSKTDKSSVDLDDNDILAQAFIFIVAGFETSSSVVTQALYELALHPDVQDKLRREIRTVLNKHSNNVTYDAIAEMHYLDMVVSETTRKYPTLPTLERVCLADYKVPGTDITIEKGTRILIPVKAIHYDPEIYPDPQRFDPERFSAENKSKRSNFAHLPFGEGPRICIGMRFGQMQVKTALVHVISSYHVTPCADTPKPPLRLKPRSTVLTPKQDIVLAFTKLKPAQGE